MGNDFIELIKNTDARFTKLEQRIASFITLRPELLLLNTSAEIAAQLDVSAMTVSRFFKKLGYKNSSDARKKVKADIYGPMPTRIGHRFENYLTRADQHDNQELESLQHIIMAAYHQRQASQWQAIVESLSFSRNLYGIGMQTMHYLAQGFCDRLKYIRPNIHILNAADGIYPQIYNKDAAKDALIIIDTYRYGADGPKLAEMAQRLGIDVIVICDEFCEWAAPITDKIIVLPHENQFFMGLPTGIHTVLNLLLKDIILILGKSTEDRLTRISAGQDFFDPYVD